ncbi:MAG: hypothetical protein Q8O62_07430 [Aequorivita sp.]|nr:hypothetical protein [Aequorivita sp.]
MNLFERLNRPTPKFFKRLRNIGIGLTAIGGTVITLHTIMPAIFTTVAGYLIVAGTVASVISQTVINDRNENGDDDTPSMQGRVIPIGNPLLNLNR